MYLQKNKYRQIKTVSELNCSFFGKDKEFDMVHMRDIKIECNHNKILESLNERRTPSQRYCELE